LAFRFVAYSFFSHSVFFLNSLFDFILFFFQIASLSKHSLSSELIYSGEWGFKDKKIRHKNECDKKKPFIGWFWRSLSRIYASAKLLKQFLKILSEGGSRKTR
jgi:hypothetical protein